MKKFPNVNKFLIKVIVVIVIILSPILYQGFNFYNFTSKLVIEIKNNPYVTDLDWYNSIGSEIYTFRNTYSFHISFVNDGKMILLFVNPWGKSWKSNPMILSIVDDYHIVISSKNGGILRPDVLEIWSEIIGIRLETIIDVVENYHTISEHVSGWINIVELRKDDYEILPCLVKRIIDEKLYTETVIYKGQEVLLLKYPVSTRWL